LILHGLEGSSKAPYAVGLGRALAAEGFEVCLLNYRGCSGEPNRLPRSYHVGESSDVRAAMEHLRATRAGRPFVLAGFSTGANLVMKLLGELGKDAPAELRGGVSVSAPFDLARCAKHLDRPAGFVYREWLLRTMRAKAMAKIERFGAQFKPSVADVRSARTFAAYDQLITAPVHGFASAEAYWEHSSGGRYLGSVARPLLVVTSADDPFFPNDYVPHDEIAKNENVSLVLTRGGGHVGFVGGSAVAPDFWAERRAVEFLVAQVRS
jgi:predicted alpha/beta-fold hydrolase